ncbi:MAG: hypothetical protein WCF22_14540 [Candidatus Sulfotelmatobacter sp.]
MLGSYGREILSVVLFIVLAVVDRSRRNLAADHVSRDDHFYATIQLTALGCAVAGDGIGFAHALLEGRNAVAIAKAAGARQYAPDSLAKAEDMLQRAEDYYQRKQGRTPIGTAARGATQMAEDARVLMLRRKEQEKLDAEKRASQEAQEKAEADALAAQAAAAQAQAQSDEDARRRAEAEQAQAQAEQQQSAAC